MIILIAEADPSLRRALVGAFAALPVEVWVAYSGELLKDDDSCVDASLSANSTVNLLLAHNTNFEEEVLPSLRRRISPPLREVRYSTVGPPKSRRAQSQYWVNRAITRLTPLNRTEAATLAAWASGRSEDLPPLLELRVGLLEALPALAILCQGYLLGHFVASGRSRLTAAIASIMPHSAFLDEAQLQSAATAWSNGLMKKASWWSAPFSLHANLLSAPRTRLIDSLQVEWGLPPLPHEFSHLMALISAECEIDDPDLITAVYCQMAPRSATVNGGNASAWESSRAKLSHDWLKNRFLLRTTALVARLEESTLGNLQPVIEYLDEILPQWPAKRIEILALFARFEPEMSPRSIVERWLTGVREPTHYTWLAEVIHSLWLRRSDAYNMKAAAENALVQVEYSYQAVSPWLDPAARRDIDFSRKLKRDLYLFVQLHKACTELSDALSMFPHETQVI